MHSRSLAVAGNAVTPMGPRGFTECNPGRNNVRNCLPPPKIVNTKMGLLAFPSGDA